MKSDRDKLLTKGTKIAIKRLRENRQLAPFGIAIERGGDVICVEPEDVGADAEDLLTEICNHLRSLAGKDAITATAIVSDVKLFDKLMRNCDDAIRVELDDSDSSPVTCYVPYSVCDSKVDTEDVIAVVGGRAVFDE